MSVDGKIKNRLPQNWGGGFVFYTELNLISSKPRTILGKLRVLNCSTREF